jgi:hypothetical protein
MSRAVKTAIIATRCTSYEVESSLFRNKTLNFMNFQQSLTHCCKIQFKRHFQLSVAQFSKNEKTFLCPPFEQKGDKSEGILSRK